MPYRKTQLAEHVVQWRQIREEKPTHKIALIGYGCRADSLTFLSRLLEWFPTRRGKLLCEEIRLGLACNLVGTFSGRWRRNESRFGRQRLNQEQEAIGAATKRV